VRLIEVFGPGCNNCKRVEANAREAVANAGVEAEIRHIVDYREIATRGVMQTPGPAIDGVMVSTGRVPSASDIAAWLGEAPA
jgi:small redox-active disulfide protein 2